MPNSKLFSPFKVRLADKDVKPEAYTVMSFTRSMGGSKVDQALVQVERAPNLYLQNSSARPAEAEQVLEILQDKRRVFWGVVEDAAYSFGESADHKTIVATIQPWLFGPPITQAVYLVVRKRNYYGDTDERVRVDEPIVFNGFAADREEWVTRNGLAFVGNKTAGSQWLGLTRDGKNTAGRTALLIPLEAVQTDIGRARYAKTYSPWARSDSEGGREPPRDNPSFEWTLRDAVRYVCVLGNDEAFIANPSKADFDSLPTFVLPRTELPVGKHLPDYLDDLLKPYGWDWYVDPVGPSIRFAKWGVGPEIKALYAKVGADADFKTTNLSNVEAGYSISQSVNKIHAKGGRVLLEVTAELYRVGQDKWVWNEGADYDQSTFFQYHSEEDLQVAISEDDVIAPQPDSIAPPSFFGLFGASGFAKMIQRRRRFLPTITVIGPVGIYGGAGQTLIDTRPIGPNGGYDIEVLDFGQEEAAEGQEEWINIDELDDPMWRHVRVLEDECGIVFDRGRDVDGDDPNESARNYFFEALDGARVRITATIELDFCVQSVIERSNKNGSPSVSVNDHTWVWWDEKRWPCRMRMTDGRFASKYAANTYHAETPSPDQIVADMKRQSREILERLDAAKVNGSIVFKGFDGEIPLGGVVKKIEGREFSFATRHGKDTPLYPQVVALHYDAQEAQIVATLSSEPANSLEAFG